MKNETTQQSNQLLLEVHLNGLRIQISEQSGQCSPDDLRSALSVLNDYSGKVEKYLKHRKMSYIPAHQDENKNQESQQYSQKPQEDERLVHLTVPKRLFPTVSGSRFYDEY